MIAEGLIANYEEGKDNSKEMMDMALARIRQLSCHEVGHTLGMGHNYAASVNERASVMDYPHPLVKIHDDGTLDLSDAYAKGIGEWDKVSIAFAYQDSPPGVNEGTELRSILDSAFSRGLCFLSGEDAGPAGASPMTATWDNGRNSVDELERVMKIRSIALSTFSEKRIRLWTPMATLEECLVTAYLLHRYQAEAAAASLGGLNFFHKLRGDVQKNPQIVAASEQRRALDMLLCTIKADFLAIDPKIVNLIPPRPPEYDETRELFPGYSGRTFDPLGAAEAAANIVIGLVLQPQRAARLVEYHARSRDNPGLTEVIDKLLSATWKSTPRTPYEAEVQRVVNKVVLTHLMGLALNNGTAPQARAISLLKLDELRKWLETRSTAKKDPDFRAHYFAGIIQIDLFRKDPKTFKPDAPLSPPPGAPIGTFDRKH